MNRYSRSNQRDSSPLIRQAPASKAFKNAKLSAVTEREHVQEVANTTQDKAMKAQLLEQLNMPDLDDKGIKIYGGGGLKFQVSDKELVMQLPSARQTNKQKLDRVVSDKVLELEKQFLSRDDKIQ